jgi:hypothetical protein
MKNPRFAPLASPVLLALLVLLVLLVGCGSSTPPSPPTPAPIAGSTEHASPIAINDHAPAAKVPVSSVTLSGIEPDRGDAEGGTYAKLKGSRLLPTAQRDVKVYFGARQGEVVRIASDNEMIVQSPAGKPGDVVDVRLTFEGGEVTLPHAFTFVKQ